jgi:O-antigen/teichoic acid export membrane protein
VSKFIAIGLQILVIPLVYHSLGPHEYELYLLLTGALATISLAQLGAGPGLTQGIAKAHAENDRIREAAILGAAFRLVIGAALLGGVVIVGVIRIAPITFLFGPAFLHDRAQILSIANPCVIVLMLQIVSGIVDSTLAGYQEQVFTNGGMAIANVFSIILLVIFCRLNPTITSIVLVIYGLPAIARFGNLFLLFKRRPYLISGLARSGRGYYGVLLHVGLAFWSIEICSIITQQSNTFILAHIRSTQDTDIFNLIYRTTIIAGAVVSMVTQPLWPAFTDALAHHDTAWIYRSYAKIRGMLTAYSCVAGLTMMIGGRWIFQHLLKIDTTGYGALFIIIGMYFIANGWSHLFYITMMGTDIIWQVAGVMVAENILMVVLALLLVPRFGSSGMGLAYLLASLLVPSWILPRMLAKTLRRASLLEHPQDLSVSEITAH